MELRQVNNHIHKRYPLIDIVKSGGCFYLASPNQAIAAQLARLRTTRTYANTLRYNTLDDWMQDVEDVLADSQRPAADRRPVRFDLQPNKDVSRMDLPQFLNYIGITDPGIPEQVLDIVTRALSDSDCDTLLSQLIGSDKAGQVMRWFGVGED